VAGLTRPGHEKQQAVVLVPLRLRPLRVALTLAVAMADLAISGFNISWVPLNRPSTRS
jgi:hypothetical protein